MDYKLKGDLYAGTLEKIRTKSTPKLTLRWKCSEKKRHQCTFKKGQVFRMVDCYTGLNPIEYKFIGSRFVLN